MIPVVTPEEMTAIDRAAPEPVDVLIARAGKAVALRALSMLGGAYGRRVTVVAGKGNNGNDGRDAARRLRQRGARVEVLDAASVGPGERLARCDLVIDAAYGTGFRGAYEAPDPGGALVLAVDIPSGVNGLTGEAAPGAVRADVTVTFAALKPGLLFHPGRALAGAVAVADIGLDCSSAKADVVEAADVAAWLPERPPETHKWRSAVWIVAGSPGMSGAASLASRGAQRSGAGYVRLSSPGSDLDADAPVEVVRTTLPHVAWDIDVLEGLGRFKALIVGPGLGTDPATAPSVHRVVLESPVPTVVDGDGLTALGADVGLYTHPLTVLTPHDGEYERLMGRPPSADRIDAARALAQTANATVLLKGATPVIADAEGRALLVITADARLATAGTGDVLSGIIGALLAQGVHPLRAAAAGAWLHGRASTHGPRRGLVASDLLECLPSVFDDLES
ncbi:MAG: ADP-dependent NAD(P)H-hydrate dehydratase / NAD(P)H-hydrate epimerase [Acidimicrobiaceae bacterium]|jgi:NAD(P)H-hydrate epimerase